VTLRAPVRPSEPASAPDANPVLGALLQGQTVTLPTAGASMRPLLRAGDTVDVAPITAWPPPLQRLVLAVLPNGTVAVHRVVATTWWAAELAGDNNRHSDGWVLRSRVLGEVVAARRGQRRLPLCDDGWTAALWKAALRGRAHLRVLRAR
jgi:hypothetical protein